MFRRTSPFTAPTRTRSDARFTSNAPVSPLSSKVSASSTKHENTTRGSIGGSVSNDHGSVTVATSEVEFTGLKQRQGSIVSDGRARRKANSESPSESGTEADDEGYGQARALPAPPVRPRKGPKYTKEVEDRNGVTPLLTPSLIDEEARKNAKEYFQSLRDRASAYSTTVDDGKRAREKFRARRRAELLRRTSETVLLGAIGCSTLWGPHVWKLSYGWHRELLTFAFMFVTLLFVYILRLLVRYFKVAATSDNISNSPIHVPSAFDPATLLYPTILPVLIALALLPTNEKYMLPNLVIGLAALPPRLTPQIGHGNVYDTIRWLVTISPIIVREIQKTKDNLPYLHSEPESIPGDVPSREILVCLYPLHVALLSLLQHLTTTSLLPAELQLLSGALLNLLLFSTSPQATILQNILWLGGLSIYITCSHVVRWSVALARVPKLKFRQESRPTRGKETFLEAVKRVLPLRLRRRLQPLRSDADDTAEDEALKNKRHPKFSQSDLLARDQSFLDQCVAHATSVSPTGSRFNPGHATKEDEGAIQPPRRRATVPMVNSNASRPRSASHSSRKRASLSPTQPYLSLTGTQATMRKWFYAGYVYVAILAIILIPVRGLIGTFALNGKEPVGWALGYLFGDLHIFRRFVLGFRLENWVFLPRQHSSVTSNVPCRRAEWLRQAIVGEANTRLLLCAYYLAIIATGLLVVLRFTIVEVDTRRKVFHGTMVAMFLPTIFIDPAFTSLALALVLTIFLLLDVIRASQLPPLSKPLARFLQPYVDGRDLRGPVIVSHIFLLVGCAIPLWLSLAGVERTQHSSWAGWEVVSRDLSMVAGVVCVGMGDAAASLIGRRYGRRRWPWAGGKSLEGSLAFVVAVVLGLTAGKVWLRVGGWEDDSLSATWGSWVLTIAKAGVAACGASLMEAVLTGGNDNVIVPVILWLLVKGLAV